MSYRAYMSREDMKRVIVFGGGEAGTSLIKKLNAHPEDKLMPVAIIDEDSGLWRRKIMGVTVVGGNDKLKETIRRYRADEVIIAIPSASRKLLKFIVNACKKEKIAVRRFGTIDELKTTPLQESSIADINLEDLLRRSSVELDMEAVERFIKEKTVLVTGGCGSIGSELCRQVLKFGCKKLLIFDINENGLFHLDNELQSKNEKERYITLLGSVRDRARLKDLFDTYHPQVVFHAAAHKHVPMMEINPREAIKNNVFGTINLAQESILAGIEKFILISTDKAVNPANVMGASKRIAEKVMRMMNLASDTEFASVRFGNVLGSNGSVVPFFKEQIERKGPVTVTHKEMCRYFMTIPEACQLVLEAGALSRGGEIFVLDMGEPVKIYDLACDMIRLSGYEPGKDIKIVFTGLRPGEKMFEEINLANENVDKTSNNKIFIMKSDRLNLFDLAGRVKVLEDTVGDGTLDEMFAAIKKLVPTFKHNKGKIEGDH